MMVVLLASSMLSASAAAIAPPNIILIFADDLGYGDIGPFGSAKNRTPNLDRMAHEGMTLTSFYAAPVCTPSRAQVLTGCYAKRVSLPNVIFPACPTGLNPAELTVAELLKERGYATMCIGKWHVGDQPEFLPTRHGFDHYFSGNALEAVRSGPWKLAIARQNEARGGAADATATHAPAPFKPTLYHLDSDIGESNDVAAQHPEVVKRLQKLIAKMDSDLGTNKPGPGVREPGRVAKPVGLRLPGQAPAFGDGTAPALDTLQLGDTLSGEDAPDIAGKPLTITDPAKPAAHSIRNIEGWTVRVDDRLLAPPKDVLGDHALRFLEYKLADIKAVMAPEPLAKLQGVTIVLDLSHGKLRSMQYHPNADWLRENGYATNLVKCVHIPEAADLATPRNITEQPWVVLHELAHAFHDQVLGFEEPRILKAYEDFRRSGHGDRTLLYDGSRVRHYGLTDQKEFFAEMTESYFGLDDFFPFNRAELMTAEPEIYQLMQAIWGPVAGQRVKSARAAGRTKLKPISQREAVIPSQAGQPCRLRCGDRTCEVKIATGESFRWSGQ